jgi:hypothetical protein
MRALIADSSPVHVCSSRPAPPGRRPRRRPHSGRRHIHRHSPSPTPARSPPPTRTPPPLAPAEVDRRAGRRGSRSTSTATFRPRAAPRPAYRGGLQAAPRRSSAHLPSISSDLPYDKVLLRRMCRRPPARTCSGDVQRALQVWSDWVEYRETSTGWWRAELGIDVQRFEEELEGADMPRSWRASQQISALGIIRPSRLPERRSGPTGSELGTTSRPLYGSSCSPSRQYETAPPMLIDLDRSCTTASISSKARS